MKKQELHQFISDNGKINILKCVASIYNNLPNYARYFINEYYNNGFCQPSFDLSEMLGFDIHCQWNMPRNLDHKELQFLLLALYDNDHVIRELFALLVERNKSLNDLMKSTKLHETKIKTMFDIIYGVASKFNYDDILEFIEGGHYSVKMEDILYQCDIYNIEKKYKIGISYVPSYKTIALIKQHMN